MPQTSMARRTTLRRRHLPHPRRLHPHRQTTHVDRIDNQPHPQVTCTAVATRDADTPPIWRVKPPNTPPVWQVKSPDKQMAEPRPPSRGSAICISADRLLAGCAEGSHTPRGVMSLSALSSCRYVSKSCRYVSACRRYVRTCRTGCAACGHVAPVRCGSLSPNGVASAAGCRCCWRRCCETTQQRCPRRLAARAATLYGSPKRRKPRTRNGARLTPSCLLSTLQEWPKLSLA
jgi:hypothetical protein